MQKTKPEPPQHNSTPQHHTSGTNITYPTSHESVDTASRQLQHSAIVRVAGQSAALGDVEGVRVETRPLAATDAGRLVELDARG